MGYYPMIDYMGAADRISRSFEDLPRVDRELEDRAMKKRLYEAQIANYDLGAKRAQREEEEYQENRRLGQEVYSDWSNNPDKYKESYFQQEEPADPDTDPIMAPASKTYSIYQPPERTIYGETAKKLMTLGRVSEAIKAQEKEDEYVDKRKTSRDNTIKMLGGLYKISKSLGRAYHEYYAKTMPELRGINFNEDADGNISTFTVINPATQEPYGMYRIGDKSPVMFPERKKVKEDIPKDMKEAAIRLARARASGNQDEIDAAKRDLDAMQGQDEWGVRMRDKYEKKGGDKTADPYKAKEANNILTSVATNAMKWKASGKLSIGDIANLPPSLQAIAGPLAQGKYSQEDLDMAINAMIAKAEDAAPYAMENTRSHYETFKKKYVEGAVKQERERKVSQAVSPGTDYLKRNLSINPTAKEIAENLDALADKSWSEEHIEEAYKRLDLMDKPRYETIKKLRKIKGPEKKQAVVSEKRPAIKTSKDWKRYLNQ